MLYKIINIFHQNSNSMKASRMKAYMKDNFEFLGINSPLRKEITKPILKEVKTLSRTEILLLVKGLWNKPQREFHYLAQEIMFRNMSKRWVKDDIEILEIVMLSIWIPENM